jgi:uncharacterized protein (DUF697 family)
VKFLKLPDLWHLLREMDLEAVRREAERPFQILLVGDAEDTDRLAALLGGESEPRHPWLLRADAADARRHAGSGLIDAALLVSHATELAPPLAATREVLGASRVPLITAVVGRASRASDALPRAGEQTRAVLSTLEPSELAAVAAALLAAVPPSLRIGLARQLPPLRAAVISALIEDTARTNALYALTTGLAEVVPVLNVPLNLADIVVLTKNQLLMSYRIALAAGKRGSGRELLGEVAGVIGSGLLFRQAGRELIGLIPGVGLVPKVAVAYAGTVAIGRAVAAWATGGQRLTKQSVRAFYREALLRARTVAKELVARARTFHPRLLRRRPK